MVLSLGLLLNYSAPPTGEKNPDPTMLVSWLVISKSLGYLILIRQFFWIGMLESRMN